MLRLSSGWFRCPGCGGQCGVLLHVIGFASGAVEERVSRIEGQISVLTGCGNHVTATGAMRNPCSALIGNLERRRYWWKCAR